MAKLNAIREKLDVKNAMFVFLGITEPYRKFSV